MQDIVPRKSIRDIEKPKGAPRDVVVRPLSSTSPNTVKTDEVKIIPQPSHMPSQQEYIHTRTTESYGGRGWQYIFGLMICGLLLTAGYLHINKKVTVFITPHVATVTLQNTIFEIPAKDIVVIEEVKEAHVPIVSTGTKNVESKAQGVVTIFNTSSQSQLLISTTRLQTPSGSIYRLDGRTTVPAAKGAVPGSIEAKVTADGLGSSYNITTADFTLPALAGSPRFKQVYARTSKGIQGGASEVVPQFEQSIVDRAIAESIVLTKKELSDRITKRLTGTSQVLQDIVWSVSQKILPNEAVVTVTGRVSTIDQGLFATLIANEKQVVTLSQGAVFADSKKGTIDSFETNTKGVRIRMSGEIHLRAAISNSDIQKVLATKSFNQFASSMKNVSGSKESKFSSKPFWIQSFPDATHIEVVVE